MKHPMTNIWAFRKKQFVDAKTNIQSNYDFKDIQHNFIREKSKGEVNM